MHTFPTYNLYSILFETHAYSKAEPGLDILGMEIVSAHIKYFKEH